MLDLNVKAAMWPEGVKCNEWDMEDAEAMVEIAAETWLESDQRNYDLVVIETDYRASDCHGIIDLLLLDKVTGDPVVIDWKTSKNTLDATWRQRLVDSFQWRLYAYLTNAQKCIYRGINRKLETKFIEIKVPQNNQSVVLRQLLSVDVMRNSLSNMQVWSLNTQSCYAFGRQCSYYKDCQGDTMPRSTVELTSLSYSQMQDFLLCPERCRRGRLDKQNDDEVLKDSEETNIGSAVHRGLAEIYRKAYKV